MRNIKIFGILMCVCVLSMKAQVGVYTTAPMASLDVAATNSNTPAATDGILVPRVQAFPVSNPGSEQHGMLLFMEGSSAYAGSGFYYWNNDNTKWVALKDIKWEEGTNPLSEEVIYAINANDSGNDVVIRNSDGFLGLGTDMPESEVHVLSERTNEVELTIENTTDEAEFRLNPGNTGSNFSFIANKDTTNGLMIYENASEEIQVKTEGALRIEDLRDSNNTGISYPTTLYAESDGTIKTKTTYSILNSIKVNEQNFSSVEMCETITPNIQVTSASFYTYTLTPTQDTLFELSYHVGASIEKFGGGLPDSGDTRHNTKIYGVILRLNGVDYSTMLEKMISNEGLNGYFHMSDHLYMPLIADGTTYTITMHGVVQDDNDTTVIVGIRGTFGGNAKDRIQIIEHI